MRFSPHARPNLKTFVLDSNVHVMSCTPVDFRAVYFIVCQPIKIDALPTPTTLPRNTSAHREN